jgi:methylenetetrahydrofolate reductase (NADPH)
MAGPTTFRDSLKEKVFTFTFELVPGRTRRRYLEEIICFAEEAARDGRLHGLSITENAGGHPALSPAVVGREIKRLGLEPILHFSCKDKNRNQIESTLFARDREGLHTLLIMTGDFPRYGFMGKAKPVFDLDAVHLLQMITEMEQGFELSPEVPGGGVRLAPIPFFKGCVVSPFKRLEAEVMPQYYKLHRKVAAGARFVITQVGFDARKFDELRRYMRLEGLNIPLLGGVMVLTRGLARLIHRGAVPGVFVSDDLLAKIEREAEAKDGGYRAALDRAARLVAILKGLGYDGVHICGARPHYEDIAYLLDRAVEYFPKWREFLPEFQDAPPDTFYLFRKDPETGLNTDEWNERADAPRSPFFFLVNRVFHDLFFEPGKAFYPLARRLARKVKGSRFEGIFTRLEYAVKGLMFGCQECGDCTLAEMAYLCPQSGCAKGLLNGPCGGSIDGWCEVYPGRKRCHYVRVYERLKAIGREEDLKKGFLPPRDWGLSGSSSWLNFYLGLDHTRFEKSKK